MDTTFNRSMYKAKHVNPLNLHPNQWLLLLEMPRDLANNTRYKHQRFTFTEYSIKCSKGETMHQTKKNSSITCRFSMHPCVSKPASGLQESLNL